MNHYSKDLSSLLAGSHETNAYFNSLPDYIRDMIAQRRQTIKSEDELRGYADCLLQGDK